MKHNVQTPSYREYGEDRIDLKPRLELVPFLGQRRLFAATFLFWRMLPDKKTGRYYRNGKFGNMHDLVTGTPIVLPQGTNTDHLWIEDKHWPSDQYRITDIPKMEKMSFTGEVAEYTTEEKQRQYGKDYVTYGVKRVDDVLGWDRYGQNLDILAEYEAGWPDCPHWTPEFSTFIPNLGNSENPNSDDSEIPMSH